jgi:hypothetical protein
MFINILLAVFCAKIKGYQIKPILKAYAIYPFVIVELLYLFLQVNIFMGNYGYLQFSVVFKNIYFFTLIIPILVYKLYKPGFLGAGLIVLGTILNRFVISQNGGKMPVFASLSKITGYYDSSAILTADKLHIIGSEATKYKILTDFIDVGYCILSVGDLLIHAVVLLIIYGVIKEVNIATRNTNDKRRKIPYGDLQGDHV